MRVLFASRRPVFPLFLGGAELSFYELARGLSEQGHQVLMIGEWSPNAGSLREYLTDNPEKTFEWQTRSEDIGGVTTPTLLRLFIQLHAQMATAHTFLSDFTNFFQDELASFEPQVVCTHLEGSAEVVEFCNFYQKPVLHFVRDSFHSPNFYVLRESEAKKRPTACIANSRFLSESLQKKFDVDSSVLYPIIDAPTPKMKRNARGPQPRVMFSNPAKVKGGELMFEVAGQLPEVQFVLVPGWGADVKACWHQLPNVEIHKWPVLDMQDLYRTVDLVVVPTQEEEAFGRVAIEAQHAGVPVAASRHSGFEEALGESAILVEDFQNPDAWRDTIRGLLESRQSLEELAHLGRKNIRRFNRRSIIGQFEHILESVA